uniref:Uncharacterized protein n=1 Tax=viral metagenome TaxID=1070528 RepID=A0A6H2A5S5_9ZZZZ
MSGKVDKEFIDTLKCLTVALMDLYCPNKEFILTKEHRKSLVGRINIQVKRETLNNLDDRYYLFP